MKNLKIGTKVKIKSEEELKELFDREYNRLGGEWNKKTETSGKIVFLDSMLQYCGRECTTASNFTGLGYYMEEIGCYWTPDWFEVIEEPPIEMGSTVVLKTITEVAANKENLEYFKYTFGELTYEDMWGKEYKVESTTTNKVGIRSESQELIWIHYSWISKVISAEEVYRREIEKYVREHDLEKELPGEDAPYDWSIEIDKHHRFIQATVVVDEFTFKVYEDPFETFIVEKV